MIAPLRPPFDLKRLLAPLRRLALVALLSALALEGSRMLLEGGDARRSAQEQRLAEARARYFETERAVRTLRSRGDAYRELVARGTVGEGQRLAWVEALQGVQKGLGMRLDYELGPTLPFVPPSAAVKLPAPLAATPMTLGMRLRHEGELPRLFDRLERESPGLLWANSCSIRRDSPERAGLEARCELLWLTIGGEGRR